MSDALDQTQEDVVTGVDLVLGVLTFRRHDGSTFDVSLTDLIGTPRANAAQAAVATTTPTTGAYGFTLAQAQALIALVNELRQALISAKIIKGSA